MKVVQVVGELQPERCGITHYAVRLAQELASQGVTSALASLPNEGVDDGTYGVPFLPIQRAVWDFNALRQLIRGARAWGADWIHLQYAPGSYDRRRVVALLPLVRRLIPDAPRVAVTMHEYGGWSIAAPGILGTLANRAFGIGERFGAFDREGLALLSCTELAICTNRNHHRTITSRSPSLGERLQVVPIGPNISPAAAPEPSKGLARLRLGVPRDQVIGVYFGFVHPVKGIEYLLRAMVKARKTQPNLRLWIVGGVHSLALRGAEADTYEATIRSSIAELGLSDVVDFTGFLPDDEVARRLQAADFAVLPFNHGATMKSGTLISCLAFGLPILTTEGGDLGTLSHGEHVWLVPPRNVDVLAGALDTLAGGPELRHRLSAAGHLASLDCDWSTIACRHRELYGDPECRNTDRFLSSVRGEGNGCW